MKKNSDLICTKSLYLHPETLNAFASKIVDMISDDIDTVIVSSVGGVPLASVLSYCFFKKGKSVRFIFLGNNSVEFYKWYLQGSKKAIIVDDLVSAGSLLAVIYHAILKPNGTDLAGIVCIAKTGFPERGQYIRENEQGIPLYCSFD